MNGKRCLYLILTLIGIGLILAGIFVFPQKAQKRAAGACYGLGAATLGLGAAWFIGTFFPALSSEEAKRRKAINVADERNVLIRDKAGAMVAKYTTYGLILWITTASLFFYGLATILPPVILLVLRFAAQIHYTNHYAKTL